MAIVGAADTAVGVLPGRTPMELCAEAAMAAIADAGLDRSRVDGLLTCNAMAQPLMYHAEALAEYLQIFPRYCLAVGAGGGREIKGKMDGRGGKGLSEISVVVWRRRITKREIGKRGK